MDLKYFTNQESGTYEILISGVVGEKVDGDQVAAEIKFLNEIGAKIIRERINSVGGGIINGMSIISANLQSKAEIHTINEGIAGSIASLILATGTPGKRSGFDFSLAVVHNPSFNGVDLDNIADEKEKAVTLKLKNSLVDIYVNNTKLTRSQATKLMTEDVLLSSQEQVEKGLIDNIIISKMRPALKENMAYAEVMNVCGDKNNFINIEIPKQRKMSDLTNFYNLVDEADESAILKKAQEDRSKLELAENKILALEKIDGERNKEISDLKTEVEKYRNESIETAVDAKIEAGVFLKENREAILENVKNIGLEAFSTFIESMPVKSVNILNMIECKDGGEKKSKEQKLGEEWQDIITNNKSEAERIKNEEPARFEAFVNAWNNLK